jgi:hypothetical protein
MSISKAQAEAIGQGFLNKFGNEAFGSKTELPTIEYLLGLYGGEFIKEAQQNLKLSNSVASGNIKDIVAKITKFGTTYTLSLGYPKSEPASKYWDFINKGVKGTKNIKADSNTPYKFSPSKKSVPVAPIEKWLSYNKLKTVSVKPYRKLGVETKAIESKKSLAYVIARSIHRKGMKSTHYFDNARKYVFDESFISVMQAALGKDIQIKIRQLGKEITNGNNNTK